MMDSGPVPKTYSTLYNKFEKLCILLAFITKILPKVIVIPASITTV
jgi:hypothetical protein